MVSCRSHTHRRVRFSTAAVLRQRAFIVLSEASGRLRVAASMLAGGPNVIVAVGVTVRPRDKLQGDLSPGTRLLPHGYHARTRGVL